MASRESGRWWALIALALSIGAVGLDGTILNTALPTMSTALHASTSQPQWFVDSFNLVMAAMLLPAGLLGDRLGRKRMILLALLAFGAGSVWCAFAESAGSLIAARAVLGMGAAFLVPLCMSVLLVLFEPSERQRAVAVMTGANLIGFPLGPILGGVLLKHFWWGSVFLINVPVVLIGIRGIPKGSTSECALPPRRRPTASPNSSSPSGKSPVCCGFRTAPPVPAR